MGNHLYRLVSHWAFFRKDVKFYEMHLHHWMAFWLIVFSYLLNFTHMGGIVMITHDIGDIFLTIARTYDGLRNKIKPIWYLNFALVLWSWIYCRLVFFPTCLIKMSYDYMGKYEAWPLVSWLYMFKWSMLCMLLVLHAYWIATFLIHGSNSVKKGSISISVNPKRQKLLEEMQKKGT